MHQVHSPNVHERHPVLPQCYEQWIAQSDVARRKLNEERVFQISRVAPEDDRPMVIASCGKKAAQRLLATLATQDGQDRYMITAVFRNPSLPGFEH